MACYINDIINRRSGVAVDKVKRTVITKLLNEGLYPYTMRYLGTFENHFSTIGLVGMNEAGLNAKWVGKDMTTKECQDFSVRVLNHMRERLSDYQEMYGDLYNLEATPAESTSYRLAKHDKKHYPDIITAGREGETPYYTNSSHLPVGYTADVFEALDIQDRLQTLYTSGTVFHCFLGEKLPDWQAAAKLVRTIAENYQLPYYTMSPTYSICQTHGYITGEVDKCPECGAPTEIYSRITGYYRAVQNWNPGKQQEFSERLEYVIDTDNLNRGIEAEAAAKQEEAEVPEVPVVNENGELLLFTTKTCPNCKLAKEFLAGMDYRVIDAEENAKLTMKYGVMQAPTLVVLKGENVEKYTNASNIRRFVSENR